MRRKFLATALAFSAVTGAAVFSLAAPAAGQAGYPPALCTATTGTVNVTPDVTVGQQFVLQLAPTCVFTSGATVTINANGVTFSDVAEPNGTVRLNVNVLSATELSIEGNRVPARCGVNTVTGTGPSSTAQGGVSTQTANFTLTCPTTGGTGGTGGTTRTGGTLSRTGSDTVRYVAVALALVVAGSMVVVATRRRRADGTA